MKGLRHLDQIRTFIVILPAGIALLTQPACVQALAPDAGPGLIGSPRERISLNQGWRFFKYDSDSQADNLIYDKRPDVVEPRDDKVADTRPTEAFRLDKARDVLKEWILPSGNEFIKNPSGRHIRPEGDPGKDFPFVQDDFDDSGWDVIDLPHDWAIKGPFLEGPDAKIGGGMGRLPVNGVAWYRRKLFIPESDIGRSVFLDVDGAMSYAMVWLNGHLVGGWPYGYNSWRLDLTPYIITGSDNQIAIRLDNPPHSARWYPGAGLYRNVWIVKTGPVHVARWGTFITTRDISPASAKVDIEISIDNQSVRDVIVEVTNNIYADDYDNKRNIKTIASSSPVKTMIRAGESSKTLSSVAIENPRLWGPPPTQHPNLYKCVTTIMVDGRLADTYETQFGIRSVEFDPDRGILVNGEHITLKGVNQHHDLGSLGAAFNIRAAERQLEILREMGCNAIRTAHNPPAPEWLELTDRMGFLVIDEIFDSWEQRKTPLDFHLIFPDWHEQDTRSFVRRDRNHPSVIIWSYGNEVGEQYTGQVGASLARQLLEIVKDEDPTRPSTTSMNYAKPGMPMPEVVDLISLNYQGEGIRDAPAYAHLQGIRTSPLYGKFHETFPGKVIISSETASTLSSRGTYLFPVFGGISAPVGDGSGGDRLNGYVSAYELYTAAFGASPDKVFAALDAHTYVAGEFVWTGWDYLGEPTPYYSSRSSYSGIIDLAGFKKDRFYLYQSRWRPDLPAAHILPSWNWPERIGQVTPVHVFTSGDEAELFLNRKSLGRKKKGEFDSRLRWDSVIYQPGKVKVVAYRNGKKWAEDIVETTGGPARLMAEADRRKVGADKKNLVFITVKITDSKRRTVPRSDNLVEFSIDGPGQIVATDNGDPTDMTAFSANKRKALDGLVLAIVSPDAGNGGTITVTARSSGLKDAIVKIKSRKVR